MSAQLFVLTRHAFPFAEAMQCTNGRVALATLDGTQIQHFPDIQAAVTWWGGVSEGVTAVPGPLVPPAEGSTR